MVGEGRAAWGKQNPGTVCLPSLPEFGGSWETGQPSHTLLERRPRFILSSLKQITQMAQKLYSPGQAAARL